MRVLRKAGCEDGVLGEVILMVIAVPDGAEEILSRLYRAGYEAYVVGGCVRDSIMGRTPGDWDITTSARPEEVKRLFRHTVDTGLAHGTVTVLRRDGAYEVTTYRIDGTYTDGRHPDSVTFTASLPEDLKRRDFTINAMAYNPEIGLVDEFGGIGDLRLGVIRAVGDPRQRFEEDALRMMRALRFAAQLRFRIDAETTEAIRELAPNLQKISAERIRAELDKILVSDQPGILRDAYELGLTGVFMPEMDVCMTCVQNTPHHSWSVGEHILRSVENIRPDRVLRLTMLLHDIGKPECRTTDADGADHFYGHQERSAQMANTILRRLKYDNDTRNTVVKLISWHDEELGTTRAEVRRSLSKVGTQLWPLLMEVRTADILAQSLYRRGQKEERIAYWTDTAQSILDAGECLTLGDLAYKGTDLIAAGMKPGAGLGAVLGRMLDDVLDDPTHNTKEYLARYITDNIS